MDHRSTFADPDMCFGLKTAQVDYTAAFVQAKIDEDVYVAMPRGKLKPGKILKLQRSLYGLKQSPNNFFDHLKEQLEHCGFTQSALDPCLFMKPNCICLTYVDDCLFFAPRQEDIDTTLASLKGADLDFNVESDVAGFLGVLLTDLDDGKIELTQTGLIDRIVSSMDLDDTNPKQTPPAEYGALPVDKAGKPPCNEGFNYPSVVGMLIYLASNSRPDIAFAVHQCARFTHHPRLIHEQALKRIWRYLLGSKTKGLILVDPKKDDLGIDLFVHADFAGMWSYEDPQDPSCVKSRTGFVIQIAGFPVMRGSRLQQQIALSTMQAEYTALSMAMRRELPPFQRLAIDVCKDMGLDDTTVSTIHSTVCWEDNDGALTLAEVACEPRYTQILQALRS
jgi:hypothetical protein